MHLDPADILGAIQQQYHTERWEFFVTVFLVVLMAILVALEALQLRLTARHAAQDRLAHQGQTQAWKSLADSLADRAAVGRSERREVLGILNGLVDDVREIKEGLHGQR